MPGGGLGGQPERVHMTMVTEEVATTAAAIQNADPDLLTHSAAGPEASVPLSVGSRQELCRRPGWRDRLRLPSIACKTPTPQAAGGVRPGAVSPREGCSAPSPAPSSRGKTSPSSQRPLSLVLTAPLPGSPRLALPARFLKHLLVRPRHPPRHSTAPAPPTPRPMSLRTPSPPHPQSLATSPRVCPPSRRLQCRIHQAGSLSPALRTGPGA